MLHSKPVLASMAIFGLWISSASAAEPVAPSTQAPAIQPAVKHSAPYTRLLGTSWNKSNVKFADQTTATAKVQTVGWHHRYYAGYAPYGYYGAPYYAGYAGPVGPYSYYTPYVYSYTPWVGGWGGYPFYTGYAGFGGYYPVGYRGLGYGYYGNYGGCCYW
jgi:hypothetical protein